MLIVLQPKNSDLQVLEINSVCLCCPVAPPPVTPQPGIPRKVVYMPACVTRMMGPAQSDKETASVHEKLMSIFQKANYEVIYPEVIISMFDANSLTQLHDNTTPVHSPKTSRKSHIQPLGTPGWITARL